MLACSRRPASRLQTAATQLLRALLRTARRPWSWFDAAAPRVQQGLTNASARASRTMEDTLYPPRDKAARRLWDTMNKFKKGGGRKSGRELLLPAESGYLRACAHHFAERLGLQHLSMGEGQARRVLLQLPEDAAHLCTHTAEEAPPPAVLEHPLCKERCAATRLISAHLG